MKNKMDLHTHSDNSPDGRHNAMLLCEYAERYGLRALAITDHCECSAYYSDRYNVSSRQAFFEVSKAKAVFLGKLVVLAGVELGQPLQDPGAADAVLRTRYDFVLASLHNLAGEPDFYEMDYTQPEHEPDAMLRRYFDELLAVARWGRFDSLAHLTYPLRYMPGGFSRDLSPYAEQIDEILRVLVQSDKALELNTSRLWQEPFCAMPDEAILRRYRELGGERLTVGSDSHDAHQIGAGVEAGMELARACGFRCLTLYQGRIPVQIPLE